MRRRLYMTTDENNRRARWQCRSRTAGYAAQSAAGFGADGGGGGGLRKVANRGGEVQVRRRPPGRWAAPQGRRPPSGGGRHNAGPPRAPALADGRRHRGSGALQRPREPRPRRRQQRGPWCDGGGRRRCCRGGETEGRELKTTRRDSTRICVILTPRSPQPGRPACAPTIAATDAPIHFR